jgi:hypothetical protein
MEVLMAGLYNVLAASEWPMTVRQVFYQAVARALIAKTEAESKNVGIRLLAQLRLDGAIPYGWIADNTRWMRKPRTYGSLEAALENAASTYRRQLWANQGAYVEIWLEKEALAGVVVDITSEWGEWEQRPVRATGRCATPSTPAETATPPGWRTLRRGVRCPLDRLSTRADGLS